MEKCQVPPTANFSDPANRPIAILSENLPSFAKPDEVDPVRAYLKEKSLEAAHNVWEMASQRDDLNIRYKANTHFLKLGGYEVDRVEHGGKVEFEPFKISRGGE